jgi:hypothetical protein
MLVPLTLLDLPDGLSDLQIASFALGHLTDSEPVFLESPEHENVVSFSSPDRFYLLHQVQNSTGREKFLPLLKLNPLDQEFYTLDPAYCYVCFNVYKEHNAAEFYGWYRANGKQREATAVESALRPHLSNSELNSMAVLVAVMKKLSQL